MYATHESAHDGARTGFCLALLPEWQERNSTDPMLPSRLHSNRRHLDDKSSPALPSLHLIIQTHEQQKDMAPSTRRANKRAASPPAPDAAPDPKQPKKATRSRKKVKVEDGDEAVKAATPEPDVKPVAKERKPSEFKEAQVAKAGTSQIPLDEGCHLIGYRVYVDPDSKEIYDASLNQTNASGNNNKFYRIQVTH